MRFSAAFPAAFRAAYAAPLLLLFLTACRVGHPFADPGVEARRLAIANLPPARLAVPPPPQPAGKAASQLWAKDLVVALVGQSLPAVTHKPVRGEWWLKVGVTPVDGGVQPTYALIDPRGRKRGEGHAAPIDEAAWKDGDPDALNIASLQMAPSVAEQLTTIQTRMMSDDPDSLMNRPAQIYFAGVTGAPGDGDEALGQAFFGLLSDGRNTVQATPKGADYTVKTVVRITPPMPGPTPKALAQQQISIVWRVLTAKGEEAGAATQLHEIPAHSLDGKWGNVATDAAQEAADAVRTIINNYSGRNRRAQKDGAPSVPPPEAPPQTSPAQLQPLPPQNVQSQNLPPQDARLQAEPSLSAPPSNGPAEPPISGTLTDAGAEEAKD